VHERRTGALTGDNAFVSWPGPGSSVRSRFFDLGIVLLVGAALVGAYAFLSVCYGPTGCRFVYLEELAALALLVLGGGLIATDYVGRSST
jgi:hypothetical protein